MSRRRKLEKKKRKKDKKFRKEYIDFLEERNINVKGNHRPIKPIRVTEFRLNTSSFQSEITAKKRNYRA